jgi:RNA polymerase sigma factor (sigma-70 family)
MILSISHPNLKRRSILPNKPLSLAASLAQSQRGKLRRFFSFRVRNPADIPDLTQEVFLRMLRIPDGDAIRSPEAYLFTVALHVAQQHAMQDCAISPSQQAEELLLQLPAAPDTDPLLQAHGEQCLETFMRALERLPPKVRATFLLHRQYGMTLKEISRELRVSFPMAKKYLAKALQQIHEQLDTAE